MIMIIITIFFPCTAICHNLLETRKQDPLIGNVVMTGMLKLVIISYFGKVKWQRGDGVMHCMSYLALLGTFINASGVESVCTSIRV